MSQEMSDASFEGKWPYFLFYFFFSDNFSDFNVGTNFVP